MTRFSIAVAFAFLLAAAALNLFFGLYLGRNAELTSLSSATAWQLGIVALALILEFGIALTIFIFIMPNDKPKLPDFKPLIKSATSSLGKLR